MEIERAELEPQPMVGMHEVVPMESLTEFFGRAFDAAAAGLAEHGLVPAGPPVAVYGGEPAESVDVTAGFPVDHLVPSIDGLVSRMLPGGPVVQAVHVGAYDDLPAAYGEVMQWMGARHLTPHDDMWEQYLVGPDASPDPSDWRTRIVLPAQRMSHVI